MSEQFISSCKSALNNLIACDKVYENEDTFSAFSEGIVNFHAHYCENDHSSPWCFHEKVNSSLTMLCVTVSIKIGGCIGERWSTIHSQALIHL